MEEQITIYEDIGIKGYRISDADGNHEFGSWQECLGFCIEKYNGRKVKILGITSIDRCEGLREKTRELEQRTVNSCKAPIRLSCMGCSNNC